MCSDHPTSSYAHCWTQHLFILCHGGDEGVDGDDECDDDEEAEEDNIAKLRIAYWVKIFLGHKSGLPTSIREVLRNKTFNFVIF